MIKIITSTLLALSLSHALTDLGTYGEVTLLEGKSFSDEINERIELIDIESVKKELDKKKKESFVLGTNLPTCSETLQREFEPIFKFEEDLIMPYNKKVLFKKNQEVNILKHLDISFPYHMLFADADDNIQKKLAYSLSGKAMIMFANGDISSFVDKEEQIYVARKEFEIKSFNIKCVPSIVTQSDNKFIINEYKPQDLMKKD